MGCIKINDLVNELGNQLKEGIISQEQYIRALLAIYGKSE